MAELVVSAAKSRSIDFGATGIKEIEQNLWMIVTTPEFSVPMERDFAYNPEIDAPVNVVQARQTARIAAAIRKYESRVQLVSITYQEADALSGRLKPVVRVKILEGVSL